MALQLVWTDEQEKYPIRDEMSEQLEALLRIAGEQEGVANGRVELTFVDDEEIRRLNEEYRGKDKATDVLSFPMLDEDMEEPEIDYSDLEELSGEDGETPEEFQEEEPLGDIVISVERASAQAEEYGHSLERELGFLFVHGFLHLIGYDHEEGLKEEKEMFAKQEEILIKAGLIR
ncbi:rRNA maturation RNase YbeY [Gorillibacterium timonense]|uniref:rRNA maturation RNase YbeY n=1 Tax=Gorillibacterium timonense TaxID=1689269 RepID=UPI00071D93D0|nr:rRNA maturation RNase YbeY [Gorillibacterium timonense]